MANRVKIKVRVEDMQFMKDYLEKNNIGFSKMNTIESPYSKYDLEVLFTKDRQVAGEVKKVFTTITFRWDTLYSKNKIVDDVEITANVSKVFVTHSCLVEGYDKKKMSSVNIQFVWMVLPNGNLLVEIVDSSSKGKHEELHAIVKEIAESHSILSLFLAYFKPEVAKYAKRQSIASQQPSSNSKKKKKKQNETVTIIPMEKFVQDVQSGNLKLPRRKCPYAFQVRGHWREYKSGKRVWIKEFTKGDTTKKKKKQVVVLGKRKEEN